MKDLHIAIAGLGTVGAGTVQLLRQNYDVINARAGRPVKIVAVSARDKNKQRACETDGFLWVDDPRQLSARDDIDVVIELMGGADGAAKEVCELALQNGKHVITANKALLAKHGVALAVLAEAKARQLMFEAAVMGGVPCIKMLREGLAANRVDTVRGILNGTCNYILTRMADAKLSFAAVLQEAQDRGYAESDPSADIDGHDTAHKLALLSALAFGVKPSLSDIAVEGIRQITLQDMHYAAELKCCIKLLGVAQQTVQGLLQRVGPCLVPMSSPLAHANDVMNALQISGNAVGNVAIVGPGAGAGPTASAVVADIIDLARSAATLPFGISVAQLKEVVPASQKKSISSWYIRIPFSDPMVDVAALLEAEGIEIGALLPVTGSGMDKAVVTQELDELRLRQAIERITDLSMVRERPCYLRIEKS